MAALANRVASNGGFVTRAELSSLTVDGVERRLVDTSRGIWNPKWMDATLTILSSDDGPYEDQFIGPGLIRYEYQKGSDDGINAKLRRAFELAAPVVMLRKLEDGVYVPIFPVYVVRDDRERRSFVVSLDSEFSGMDGDATIAMDLRSYAQAVVRKRLHQAEFRARVLRAYSTRCAICELRHAPLLDAAHIVADSEAMGQPLVRNGLSLCKIHHSAYDANIIGIDPSGTVAVRPDVLAETDGPMLTHGIQAMHGRRIMLPSARRDRPDRDRLAMRFDVFSRSG